MVKRTQSKSDKIIKSSGRKSSYKLKYAKRVKELIMELVPLNNKGELAYGKIAKALGVPARTMREWRNPYSNHFKPDFAKSVKDAETELFEGLDSDKVKRGVIERAIGYKRIKKIKELVTKGPRRPPLSVMTVDDLLKYAEKELGLKLEGKLSKSTIILAIEEEINNQTTEVMKLVRQEEEQMPADVAAAKLVLPNIGPEDKRWRDKQVTELEVNEETATLLGIIDGISKGRLPNEEVARKTR